MMIPLTNYVRHAHRTVSHAAVPVHALAVTYLLNTESWISAVDAPVW